MRSSWRDRGGVLGVERECMGFKERKSMASIMVGGKDLGGKDCGNMIKVLRRGEIYLLYLYYIALSIESENKRRLYLHGRDKKRRGSGG